MSRSKLLVLLGLICALCVASFGVASADVRSKESGATRDIVLVEDDAEEGENAEAKLQVEEMALEGDPFGLRLWSDRSEKGDVYDIGDKMTIMFKAEKDCYLTILDFAPSGSVYKLFPNKWMADGFVKAGQEIAIPAKGQKFSLKVGGPAAIRPRSVRPSARAAVTVVPASASSGVRPKKVQAMFIASVSEVIGAEPGFMSVATAISTPASRKAATGGACVSRSV